MVVAGVAASSNIGIDIEQIRPVSQGVFKRILSPKEALLFKGTDQILDFYRAFTAKESVLKCNGKGLASLSGVRIDSVGDDKNLIVTFLNRKYKVENFINDSYLASITKKECKVVWIVKPAADPTGQGEN